MKTTDNFADITIDMNFATPTSCHQDIFHARRVNISRDLLYESEPELLIDLEQNDIVQPDPCLLKKYFQHRASDIITIKKQNIKRLIHSGKKISPGMGRFYPKGMLGGVTHIFSANMYPFRCIDLTQDAIVADLNDPLCGNDLSMKICIDRITEKRADAGSSFRIIMEETGPGPGMQARFKDRPTDFFSSVPSPGAFGRSGPESDAVFYRKPRFTAHTDRLCREQIRELYTRLIPEGSKVLDFMASIYSHLPMDKEFEVTGLGMNKAELAENKILSETIIQDINQDRHLPVDDNSFDAVVCAMSVEYMTDPFAMFDEIKRVLKKNGLFIITFSSRWFPGREIQIWNELHEFEKMGLIAEYFFLTKGFGRVHTLSMRGFPRPDDPEDRYNDSLLLADPLFAVWSQKKGI